MRNYLDKTIIKFYHGSAFDNEGIDKVPFAVFKCNEIISQNLINSICDLVKSDVNDSGEICNYKIQSEYHDA